MDILALILVVLVVAAVLWLVTAPLRARAAGRETPAEVRDAQRVRDLELRKEQVYAEIRELEMDLRTGKLSEEDHRVLDRGLRADAVQILHELDQLGAGETPAPDAPDAEPAPDGDATRA